MTQLSIPVNETQFKQATAVLLVMIMFSRDLRISFLFLCKPARLLGVFFGLVFFQGMFHFTGKKSLRVGFLCGFGFVF